MIWMLILFIQTSDGVQTRALQYPTEAHCSAAADYARSAGRETGVTLSALCLPAGEPA